MNKWKKTLSIMLTLLMIITIFSLDSLTKKVYAVTTMQVGDYVKFGTYLGKPILWRVINIDSDGSPMLYSEKILCLKPFDAAESGVGNRGRNKWENSNISEWLNSSEVKVSYSTTPPTKEAVWDGYNSYADEAGFLSNFTEQERNQIKPVTKKTILADIDKDEKDGGTELIKASDEIDNCVTNYDQAYYKNVEDKVCFLDVKELHDYVYNRGFEYKKMPTEEAVSASEYKDDKYLDTGKYYSCWLKTPASSDYERDITSAGKVHIAQVSYYGEGVAPALNLKSATFESGKGTIEEPYVLVKINSMGWGSMLKDLMEMIDLKLQLK